MPTGTIIGENAATYSDAEVIARILDGQQQLFELLVRRNNARLYRIGRSFGFDHCDTEDLMQEAHIDAFLHLATFEQRSSYATWITRLMLNRCGQRLRKQKQQRDSLAELLNVRDPHGSDPSDDPASLAMKSELGRLIEKSLLDIPINYRMVFTLRELEQMNVAETAEALGISEVNVKVRLNRARSMLREKLKSSFDPREVFEFNLIHCGPVTARVMERVIHT
jgi:RNA polymerase sigma-70 factor (ECF subfamily)